MIAANLVAMLSSVLLAVRVPPGLEGQTSEDPPAEDSSSAVDPEEPSHRLTKTLRRWMLAIPGRLVRGAGRRRHLRLPLGALWAEDFIAMYERLRRMSLAC